MCGLLAAFLAALLIIAAARLMYDREVALAAMERELALARSAGEPITYQELAIHYGASGRDNEKAARELTTALPPAESDREFRLMLGSREYGTDDLPPPDEPWPQLPKVTALLERHAGVLERLHAAARDADEARFPAPTASEAEWSAIVEARHVSELLIISAYVAAHGRDSAATTRSLLDALAIGRSLEDYPDEIAFLSGQRQVCEFELIILEFSATRI